MKNIIDQIFRGGKVEQATMERTKETDPAARLRAIEAEIASGTGDVVTLLAEKEALARQVQAERITRDNRQSAEYRRKVTAAADERRERMDSALLEVGDLVPRLLLACAALNEISSEIQQKGLGFTKSNTYDEILGVPANFGAKVIAAINDAAPATDWDWSHTGPGSEGRRAEKPKLQTAKTYTLKAGMGSRPPNYSGSWPPLADEPVEGPAAPFPPIEARS